ncbi:MAG: nucleotidyl transferase AbiEii/AbiGii toxin family protein [Chloroflexota bacterium]
MDRSYPSLTSFDPRLDILPAAQRAVWPRLVHLPIDAVLYRGTAIALRLGHRASVDFDLFLPRSFEPGEMRREVAGLGPFEVVRTAVDTLSVIVDDVWVSLFGVKLASVASPEVAADIGLPVASLLDVGATKMQTIVDRAESRDYLDIAEILAAGLPLADLLGAAQVVFGPSFSPMLALKALTSYTDGSLDEVPIDVRQTLEAAAGALRRITVMDARATTVTPSAPGT